LNLLSLKVQTNKPILMKHYTAVVHNKRIETRSREIIQWRSFNGDHSMEIIQWRSFNGDHSREIIQGRSFKGDHSREIIQGRSFKGDHYLCRTGVSFVI